MEFFYHEFRAELRHFPDSLGVCVPGSLSTRIAVDLAQIALYSDTICLLLVGHPFPTKREYKHHHIRPTDNSMLPDPRADNNAEPAPTPGDALVIVDVQNDFLPGGSLAVPKGDEIILVLNRFIKYFADLGLPVVATRDWHPPNHCSFQRAGGPWPAHCIANSTGAEFAPVLQLPTDVRVVSKATGPDRDAYSGFSGTDLDQFLRSRKVSRIFVGGLATDYCVLNTVKDALALGYQVVLLRDAIRAVDVHPGDGARAEEEMRGLGAVAASAGGDNK